MMNYTIKGGFYTMCRFKGSVRHPFQDLGNFGGFNIGNRFVADERENILFKTCQEAFSQNKRMSMDFVLYHSGQ